MQNRTATIVVETRAMCRCCKRSANHSESRCWSNPAGRSYQDRRLGTRASLRDMIMNGKVITPSNSFASGAEEERTRAGDLSKLDKQQPELLGLLTDGLSSEADVLDKMSDSEATVEAVTAYKFPPHVKEPTEQPEDLETRCSFAAKDVRDFQSTKTAHVPQPLPPVHAPTGTTAWATFAVDEHNRQMSFKTPESWAEQKRKIEEAKAQNPEGVQAGHRFRSTFKKTTRTVDGSLNGRRVADSIETTVYDADGSATIVDTKDFVSKQVEPKNDEERPKQVNRPKALPPHLRHKDVLEENPVEPKKAEEGPKQVNRPRISSPHLKGKEISKAKKAEPKQVEKAAKQLAQPKSVSLPPAKAAPEVKAWASFAVVEHKRQMSFKTSESWTKQKQQIEKAADENREAVAGHRFREIFKSTSKTIDGTLNGRRVADSIETTVHDADGSKKVIKKEVFHQKDSEPENSLSKEVKRPKFIPPHLKQKVDTSDAGIRTAALVQKEVAQKEGDEVPTQGSRPKVVPPHLKQKNMKNMKP